MTDRAASWDELVDQAGQLGFTVELVEYVEGPESPGLLGAGLGVCIHRTRRILIREKLRPADRCFVLEHELDHARIGHDRQRNADLDERFHREQAPRIRLISDYLYR